MQQSLTSREEVGRFLYLLQVEGSSIWNGRELLHRITGCEIWV